MKIPFNRFIFFPAVYMVLVGCAIGPFPSIPQDISPSAAPVSSDTPMPGIYSTPSDGLSATLTPQPTGIQTEPQFTLTPISASSNPGISPTPTRVCNLAAAGRPFDITIPDNTQIGPGESFTKTWRLLNNGSCPWSRSYSVVWFSGDNLAYRREVPLRATVLPGQTVDFSVDLISPQAAGIYQSNWKLRDPNGQLFGIGPGSSSPFWARIEVVVTETLTPTAPQPSETPLPVVHSSGSAVLGVGQSFDLDGSVQGPGAGDDFVLQMTDGQIDWVPQNGARVAIFGAHPPSMGDCHDTPTANMAIRLTPDLPGTYLCVRTDMGLPASLFLTHLDPASGFIEFRYTVWSIP